MLNAIVAGLAFAGVIQMATTENFFWTNEVEIATPPLGQVAVYDMGLVTGNRGEVSPCTYKAVYVPYEQDWEETRTVFGVERVIPAAPGKAAGAVVLVLSERCPDAQPKPMMWASASAAGAAVVEWHTPRWSSIIFHGGGVLRAGMHFKEMPAILAENPKWKDQVFRRIDTAAETNPEIAEMLAELKEKGPQPLFQSGPKTPF